MTFDLIDLTAEHVTASNDEASIYVMTETKRQGHSTQIKGRSQKCVEMERVGDCRALSGRLGGLCRVGSGSGRRGSGD
jgi:hypothetical protein